MKDEDESFEAWAGVLWRFVATILEGRYHTLSSYFCRFDVSDQLGLERALPALLLFFNDFSDSCMTRLSLQRRAMLWKGQK